MDVTPSRRMSFASQVEENATDVEIDDHHYGSCDSKMDRSGIIIGIKVCLESGHSQTEIAFAKEWWCQ